MVSEGVRLLLLALFLGSCDGTKFPNEVSYELSCQEVVCEHPDLETAEEDYKSCQWCQKKFVATHLVFRRTDGCWNLDREFSTGTTTICF